MDAKATDVSTRFDAVAAQWDANPGRVALAQSVARAVRQHVLLRPDMAALDFGAGTGLLSLALLPHVAAITAVDASGQMLRVLDEKLRAAHIQRVHTLLADIASDTLPPTAYDLVVSSMALHHVQDVPQAIRHLRACLRTGGWIALADLDKEDGSFHGDNMAGVYHSGFNRSDLCAWLTDSGFTDVAVHDAHRMDKNGRQYGVLLVIGRAG